jgi:tRNA G46 methylase TrmB
VGTGPQNLDRMTTIYGPTTWDVYAQLDESLDPRGPDMLYDVAGELIGEGDAIPDAGCRDASHLIELARRHPSTTGIGVEPVAIHVDRAREAVRDADLDNADWKVTTSRWMRRHLGWLESNVRRSNMEAAFATAGFACEQIEEVGTEWREYAEERT